MAGTLTKKITLHFERETKGTVRYDEQREDRPMVLYLEKSRFFVGGTQYPKTITVTVEV